MLKCLAITTLVLLSSFSAMTGAQAQKSKAVTIAIGQPGSESFVFGTELWAMTQIALRTQHGIDISAVEVADDHERLALLKDAGVEVALVQRDVPTSYAGDMRTIMALWPEGGLARQAEPAQILARQDVPDEVVYRITKAIFENPRFFRNTAKTTFGLANLDRAMIGADLPIHPGAYRYYDEQGVSLSAAAFKPVVHARTETKAGTGEHDALDVATFKNFDDRALNQEERAQIAAACLQALDLGVLSAVLGDLSSSGCEVYQSYLKGRENDQRQQAAAGRDFLALPSGQGGPAIALESVVRREQGVPATATDNHPQKSNPRQPTM